MLILIWNIMKNFKDATLKNYHDLAKHYALKLDAKEF